MGLEESPGSFIGLPTIGDEILDVPPVMVKHALHQGVFSRCDEIKLLVQHIVLASPPLQSPIKLVVDEAGLVWWGGEGSRLGLVARVECQGQGKASEGYRGCQKSP